jgi:hypothetical protein
MALTDIFTTPFLISLGITLVLIGLLGMYLTQKLQEQNHKITSMFGLVTSMAEEMNFIRNRFQGGASVGPTPNVSNAYTSASTSASTSDNKLIDVSDGEEDDTDSSSESDDGYDDSSSEGDSVDDDLEEVDLSNKIKVVNISENFTINSSMNDIDVDDKREEIDVEELDCDGYGEELNNTEENDIGDDDADDLSSKSSSSSSSSSSSDDELVNDGSIVVEELNGSEFIKSITMSLEATNIEISDYKKMSLNKLRALVIEKKLTSNANKLKKEELLKLLNAE